jgi:hypothetical protein
MFVLKDLALKMHKGESMLGHRTFFEQCGKWMSVDITTALSDQLQDRAILC